MKSVLTYLVVLAFMLSASGKVFVYMNFYLNQEYIAENLCENREEPELECNGKCHLAKELAKEEKKEKQEDKHQFKDTTVYYLSKVEKVFEYVYVPQVNNMNHSFVIEQKPIGFSSSVFHPPSIS